MAKLVPFKDMVPTRKRQLGTLASRFSVPKDFDRFGEEEIRQMFEGNE